MLSPKCIYDLHVDTYIIGLYVYYGESICATMADTTVTHDWDS